MTFVLALLLQGLLFGVVLRAVLPGQQRWSIGQTVIIGAVGWWVLGFIVRVLLGGLATVMVWLALIGGTSWFLLRRRRPLPR
jgi:uncharacterized membrane protein YeaQ/YmgE (transglycosylase-associated protein family)